MDLWQLHIFCKVVELKSFSRAGRAIHLSQPTVSSHIKDLEGHVGCLLIDRLAREAVPTGAGKLLYDYARRMLALRSEAETALAEFQGKIRGSLVVGGSTIPCGYILPQIIGRFSVDYPEVRVSLVNGDTAAIIRQVREGLVEIGIVGARTEDGKIVQERLIEDELILAVPAGHRWAGRRRVHVEQLLDEPFIVRESGSGTRTSVQKSLSEKGFDIEDLKVAAEMGSTQAVLQGIKAGIGVSILSKIAVEESVESRKLSALEVAGLDLRRCFYLTRHHRRSASPLGLAFVEFLKSHSKNGS